jgi:hypothetical protein
MYGRSDSDEPEESEESKESDEGVLESAIS